MRRHLLLLGKKTKRRMAQEIKERTAQEIKQRTAQEIKQETAQEIERRMDLAGRRWRLATGFTAPFAERGTGRKR